MNWNLPTLKTPTILKERKKGPVQNPKKNKLASHRKKNPQNNKSNSFYVASDNASNNGDFQRSSVIAKDPNGYSALSRSSHFTAELLHIDVGRSSQFILNINSTWWKHIPALAKFFIQTLFFPILLLKYILDLVLSFIVVCIFGSIILWYIGWIPEEVVVNFFGGVGDRGLSILERLGVPL